MKLSDGVEQAIHSITMMAGLPADGVLSAADLAAFHGVSPSYLLKHLQALSKAKLVTTLPGPKGGYRLARGADQITLLDIVLAVEGPEPAFRCREIRQRGPNPLPASSFTAPCGINAAMLKAERAYRAELRKVTVQSLLEELVQQDTSGAIRDRGCAFLTAQMRQSPKP